MTTDQPQPGPALDKAIAKALGWRKASANLLKFVWWKPTGHGAFFLPRFSTDDATALATLQQLNKPVEEGGRGWAYVIFSPGEISWTYQVEVDAYLGECQTFPHAAALAMLAALEKEK